MPGAYALAHGWVAEAVLPSFRESAGGGAAPDLDGWFASPWVQAHAQARLALSSLNPLNLVRAAAAAVAACFAMLAARVLGGGGRAEARDGEGAYASAAAAAPARRERRRDDADADADAAAPAAAAGAEGVAAAFEREAEDAVLEFDRSKLEKEVVTVAELKRRLNAVLADDGAGESAADKWRQQAAREQEEADDDAEYIGARARRTNGSSLPHPCPLLLPAACSGLRPSSNARRRRLQPRTPGL